MPIASAADARDTKYNAWSARHWVTSNIAASVLSAALMACQRQALALAAGTISAGKLCNRLNVPDAKTIFDARWAIKIARHARTGY